MFVSLFSWWQAGGPPSFCQRRSQCRRKCEGGAEAASTEGRLQGHYSRGDCLRLFYAPKLDERRHEQTLRDAEPGVALNVWVVGWAQAITKRSVK